MIKVFALRGVFRNLRTGGISKSRVEKDQEKGDSVQDARVCCCERGIVAKLVDGVTISMYPGRRNSRYSTAQVGKDQDIANGALQMMGGQNVLDMALLFRY